MTTVVRGRWETHNRHRGYMTADMLTESMITQKFHHYIKTHLSYVLTMNLSMWFDDHLAADTTLGRATAATNTLSRGLCCKAALWGSTEPFSDMEAARLLAF